MPSDPSPTDPDWAGGSVYVDERSALVATDLHEQWRAIEGIGGEHGWYSLPLAWAARGMLDRLAGGVGLRRGRRDPDRLRVGEPVDFWRVEALEPGRLLRLRAEMKLPGSAWLEFRLAPADDAGAGPGDDGAGPGDDGDAPGTLLYQRATFIPRGLPGHLYWWAVWPFHGVVFGSMLRNLVRGPSTPVDAELAPTTDGDRHAQTDTEREIEPCVTLKPVEHSQRG